MTTTKETVALKLRTLNVLGAKCHHEGDKLAKQAKKAKYRREERRCLNASRASRNTGTAVEATLFLYALMCDGFVARKSEIDPGLRSLDRLLEDGANAAVDLSDEAFILSNYKSEPNLKKKGR